MNLLKNKLRILEEENKNNLFDIESPENRLAVKKIVQYLSASNLPLYQIQVIQKDLIGMAIEAEQEHITFSEKLGVDPKEFCQDIIRTSDAPARQEHIMRTSLMTLQTFTACYTLSLFFHTPSQTPTAPSPTLSILLIVCWALAAITLPEYLRNKLALEHKHLSTPVSIISNFICALLYFTLYSYIFRYNANYGTTTGGWIFFTLLLLLTIAATIAANRYWYNCSKKYPH